MHFTKTTVAIPAVLAAALFASAQAQSTDQINVNFNGNTNPSQSDFNAFFSSLDDSMNGAFSSMDIDMSNTASYSIQSYSSNGVQVINYIPITQTSGGANASPTSANNASPTPASNASPSPSNINAAISSVMSSAQAVASSVKANLPNAALVNTNHGMPLNALVATFTVFLGSAIAGAFVL